MNQSSAEEDADAVGCSTMNMFTKNVNTDAKEKNRSTFQGYVPDQSKPRTVPYTGTNTPTTATIGRGIADLDVLVTSISEKEEIKPTSDAIELTTRTTGSSTGHTTSATTTTGAAATTSAMFEQRDGHAVTFNKLVLTVKSRMNQNCPPTPILVGVSGHVPPRKITAIMGPSGSGKSSLLKVLTGRLEKSKFELSGQVKLNGRPVDPWNIAVRRKIAYVEQDVSIPPTCTPREAIHFSAQLRLDKSLSPTAIQILVDEILNELGLEQCADSMIGGGLLIGGGISGGEKKRTQCGVELVTKPGLVILDEPTTGLSSFDAQQFVGVLQRISRAGATVLLTIHQPPPTVVRELDQLILLRSGKDLYAGPMGVELFDYFADKGFPKPSDYNIADWILTIAQSLSLEELNDAGFLSEQSNTILNEGPDKLQDSAVPNNPWSTWSTKGVQRVGWRTQINLLLTREFKHLVRDKGAFMIRMGTTAFFGLLYGVIYLDIGNTDLSNQINVSSTFGALAVFLVTTISGVSQSSLMDFPKDRPVFLREFSTNHYTALPYFISHFCFECFFTVLQTFVQVLVSYFLMNLRMNFFVFWSINVLLAIGVTSFGTLLGSVVENPAVAIQLMPALVVPQMLFSGFFISSEMIPSFLRWIQYLCALTYAMRLALVYEFEDCPYETCTETLDRNGVFELDRTWYWVVLLAITVFSRVISMMALRGKANYG